MDAKKALALGTRICTTLVEDDKHYSVNRCKAQVTKAIRNEKRAYCEEMTGDEFISCMQDKVSKWAEADFSNYPKTRKYLKDLEEAGHKKMRSAEASALKMIRRKKEDATIAGVLKNDYPISKKMVADVNASRGASRKNGMDAGIEGAQSISKNGKWTVEAAGKISCSAIASPPQDPNSELASPASDQTRPDWSSPLGVSTLKLGFKYSESEETRERRYISLTTGLDDGQLGIQIGGKYCFEDKDGFCLAGKLGYNALWTIITFDTKVPNYVPLHKIFFNGSLEIPIFKNTTITPSVEVSDQFVTGPNARVGGGLELKYEKKKSFSLDIKGKYTYISNEEAPYLKFAQNGTLALKATLNFDVGLPWLSKLGLEAGFYMTNFEGQAGDNTTAQGPDENRYYTEKYMPLRITAEIPVGGGWCIPVGVGPDMFNEKWGLGFNAGFKRCDE